MKHNPLHQWQKEHNKRVKDFHKTRFRNRKWREWKWIVS